MEQIRHMAMCTKNNRRLARFYHLIFDMEEVWNPFQNSPYAFYITDGYINLNCLQIRPGSSYNKQVEGREVLAETGINHIGFQVQHVKEIEKRLAELSPPIRLEDSPQDGRYEEKRALDPDGNIFELAVGGWEAGAGKKLPAISHITIRTEDPSRLADFYKSILSMKEVRRVDKPETGTTAIFLADGGMNLALVKGPSGKPGLERVGIQVRSIRGVEERTRKSPPFLYPGEPPIQIGPGPSWSPYRCASLKDPDGNLIDLSEEGWEL